VCTYLKHDQKEYDIILQNIKENYLSQSCMPKLLLGTGLSIVYKLPGMASLFKQLSDDFIKCTDTTIVSMWESKKDDINKKGLEEGLSTIVSREQPLVDQIRKFTASFILKEENSLFNDIYNKDTGFRKLLSYLKETCSVNERILDIMTPNYDRIIETVCDCLNINVITGFEGENTCHFNQRLLKRPESLYNIRDNFFVRLFKPHGSLNWISMDQQTILTNDNMRLLDHSDDIEIITPGGSKYKDGMINAAFRCMREDFNEVLDSTKNYSLFIFGYGFNDAHFDTVLFDYFKSHNTLIVSKDIKESIIDMSIKNSKMVLFYEKGGESYIIYKCQKFKIDHNLWDINEFASVLIG